MADFKFFIIPRARTGGTLLATMLNAHPEISMCYEIYPDLLLDSGGSAFVPKELLRRLKIARRADFESWVKALGRDNFRVFAARARRSGIEPPALLLALKDFVKGKRSLDMLDDRLDLIDLLLHGQAKHVGKGYVGGKMRTEPNVLYRRHPQAVFLMTLRDGRDVLDSRLKVGSFKATPADCAHEWCDALETFEGFLRDTGAKGCLVRYEDMVAAPEKLLTPVMALAGLSFDPLMVNFTQVAQPLFKNAHGHLSAKQLSGGLNSSSIGRWRNGLSSQQVDEFMAIAGDEMRRYGYV
ncbi:sulfotransferase [Deltaproteobacteria bacterium]|nr:sulfotransferase [Deltaproteobacteria bacterium]